MYLKPSFINIPAFNDDDDTCSPKDGLEGGIVAFPLNGSSSCFFVILGCRVVLLRDDVDVDIDNATNWQNLE